MSNSACRAWLNQNLTWWLKQSLDSSRLCDEYSALNKHVKSLFIFHVCDQQVSILSKPEFPNSFKDSSRYSPYTRRALYYRDFFDFVVRAYCITGNFIFALDIEDQPAEYKKAPVLVFQKPSDSVAVLLPDIDFLYEHFYTSPTYNDHIPYANKHVRAAFAGATTGGGRISLEAVRSLSVPRIRAGVFFLGNPDVDYRLPRIVQCEGPDVVEAVRHLGIPDAPTSWTDQFRSRFLISLDGNGATCSRVAIALHSNCVLLKYESPHQLCYFSSLVPWLHYIPIKTDQDVLEVIALEKRNPGHFEYMAAESRALATQLLSRENLCHFTALLLSELSRILPTPTVQLRKSASVPARRVPARSKLDYEYLDFSIVVNVEGKGDLWGWPGLWVGDPGSGFPMNGFAIYCKGDLKAEDVEYCFIGLNDYRSAWVHGGNLCGSRGSPHSIVGISIRLVGSAAKSWRASYQCSFIDGSVSGTACEGEDCVSPTKFARLEGIQLRFFQKKD